MKEYRQHRFTRPPGATEILLVRHGESRAAIPGQPFPLVNGQGDPELSALGRAQAERIAKRLALEPIDAIYVTNLCRTHETAAPLAVKKQLNVIEEPDLREVHLGEWEGGLLRIKAAENDPVFIQMLSEQRWDVIPGAESHAELKSRVFTALDRIINNHPDQLVVVVVHGGVVGHILAEATQSAPFAFNGCDNASISHIVALGGRIMLRRYNDAAHLNDLESDASPT